MKVAFLTSRVATGCDDEDGLLVYVEDRLSAVLVRLDDVCHGDDLRGRWFVEAAFGPFGDHVGAHFGSTEEVRRWASDNSEMIGGGYPVACLIEGRQVAQSRDASQTRAIDSDVRRPDRRCPVT